MISRITKKVKGAIIAGTLLMGSNAFAQLGLTWGEMGPNDIAGRCRSIIVDKTNASGNTLFAAGVSGGVFKSTNGGSTWFPVNDQAPSLIVSCMDQDPSGNVFFGTGETFGRGGDGAGLSGFVGTGLYKITANTSTITKLQDSLLFGNINEIAVASTNTIYIAADKGFFISTDGGSNFTEEATSASGTLAAMDVKLSKNGDVYYSAGAKGYSLSTVYFAASGSSSFTNITPTSITNRGRIEIATSPVDNNYVYLSIAKQKTSSGATGGLSAVLVSNVQGTSWSIITIGTAQFDPFLSGAAGYGDYANTIVADPLKKDACFLGGEVLYFWSQISSNPLGQGSWTQIGNPFAVNSQLYLHSKIHDIKFKPGSNTIYYVASDGGISKSEPLPTGYPLTLTPFLLYNNGFNISQFNSVTFPIYPRANQTSSNTLDPAAGVAGGAVGNSLTYLPGYYTNGPMTSNSFGFTDGYQADFSRISPKALIYSGAYGSILRNNDVDIATSSTFYDKSYQGGATGGPGATTFANENTPMRLWENYDYKDSSYFFNEPPVAFIGNNDNTRTRFGVANIKLQRDHRYEKVTITTTSSKLVGAPANQTITIVPVYNGPNKIVSHVVTGNANTSSVNNNKIALSTSTATPADSIIFTFATAPKDSSEIKVITDLSFQTTDMGVTSTATTNVNASATSFMMIPAIRPKAKYHYTNMMISIISTKSVSPLPTQTVNIAFAPYTGNSIPSASQMLTGAALTGSVGINNTTLKDTLRLTFASAPDSCRFDLTCDYITYDSIIVKNTDVSGYNFETGELVTSYVSTSVTPVPLKKLPLQHSARLAVGINEKTAGDGPSVFVVKRPLNFAINPDWVKIAGKLSRQDSAGGTPYLAPSTAPAPNSITTSKILGTTVTHLEWAPDGSCIYFSTKLNNSTYYLYRISHLQFVGDSASADYSGLFTSDVDSTSTALRKTVKQRTTPIGMFNFPITGIAVTANNANLMVTVGSYMNNTGTVYYSNSDPRALNSNTVDASNFSVKNGTGLPMIPAYTGIFEMNDNKVALVGTESGIYSTLDITQATPTWVKETGGNFPNVPVFQLRQQTFPHWKCYNSGTIYAATHGRGIWSTDKFFVPYAIGIEEHEKVDLNFSSNIKLFPNPASDATNVWFKAADNTSYKISVYDINGRLMIEQTTAKLMEGEQVISLNTAELTSGVYFVSVAGSNNSTVNTKLVITH